MSDADRSPAELILAFVSELADDQLSVAAIHRIYRGIDRDVLVAALGDGFELSPAGAVYSGTPAEMLAFLRAEGPAANAPLPTLPLPEDVPPAGDEPGDADEDAGEEASAVTES